MRIGYIKLYAASGSVVGQTQGVCGLGLLQASLFESYNFWSGGSIFGCGSRFSLYIPETEVLVECLTADVFGLNRFDHHNNELGFCFSTEILRTSHLWCFGKMDY